jgi:hypothetical protein
MVLRKGEYSIDLADAKKTYDQMIELIQNPDIQVIGYTEDENSYGEFLFIALYDRIAQAGFMYYGCGFSELYDRPVTYFKGDWDDQSVDFHKHKHQKVELGNLISLMTRRYQDCLRTMEQQKTRSDRGILTEELVDAVGDEDGIMAEMEDIFG